MWIILSKNRWSLKRGENFQREQYIRFNTLKSHEVKKTAERPRVKSKYSIEEMVQSAAQRADGDSGEAGLC